MRRLDLQPTKKLRNPRRHLRQLARWPERIVEQIPDSSSLVDERYWNFKLPAAEKLVEPPYATNAIRKACLVALFEAAEAVEHSARRPENSRVACLVTTPFLFSSEVTIFLSEDYFHSFLPVPDVQRTDYRDGWVEASPADASLLNPIRPPEPNGLEFFGGTRLLQFDEEGSHHLIDSINWVWAFPRR
ncbi:DUF3916 domain-containing protein [Nocardia pseudovaccinii]|uniref:DUF3916 domain-containing protein n=1 Tax=Nocardia pseudovaccinii TaxID=189540 RepID=UPI0007A48D09|nr:DUF3916 domain-containing protein [Nocardia pseudovaccinii]